MFTFLKNLFIGILMSLGVVSSPHAPSVTPTVMPTPIVEVSITPTPVNLQPVASIPPRPTSTTSPHPIPAVTPSQTSHPKTEKVLPEVSLVTSPVVTITPTSTPLSLEEYYRRYGIFNDPGTPAPTPKVIYVVPTPNPTPEITRFDASTYEAKLGDQVTIAWDSKNAITCAITETRDITIPFMGRLPNGSTMVTLRETANHTMPTFAYFAICADKDWNTMIKELSLQVYPLPTPTPIPSVPPKAFKGQEIGKVVVHVGEGTFFPKYDSQEYDVYYWKGDSWTQPLEILSSNEFVSPFGYILFLKRDRTDILEVTGYVYNGMWPLNNLVVLNTFDYCDTRIKPSCI